MEKVDPYAELGGDEGVRALVERFYDQMERLPEVREIRAMHDDDLDTMRERLYEFLSGWLGGPPLYQERHGSLCIRSAHAPFPIGADARDQWLLCMARALDEAKLGDPTRGLLDQAFARIAGALVNRSS